MNGILIIDDEVKLRSLIARIIRLEGDGNFLVAEADNGKAALKKIAQENFDVIICDVKLPDINGVELIKEIKARQPLTEIILLTAYGNIPDGVQAIKNGAFDYITKGDDNNKILPLLYKAIEKVSFVAPVNAPSLCPNNSFSSSSLLKAAQLTATKLPLFLLLAL